MAGNALRLVISISASADSARSGAYRLLIFRLRSITGFWGKLTGNAIPLKWTATIPGSPVLGDHPTAVAILGASLGRND
jgi:hypothetical protein